MEAIRAKTLFVATNIDSFKELVCEDNTKYFFDLNEDVEVISSRIYELINNKIANDIVNNNYLLSKKYDLNLTIKSILNIYAIQ